jgi:hypothetical protein
MAKGFGQLVLTRQQQQEAKLLRKIVLQHFQHLPDPRVSRKKDYTYKVPSILRRITSSI